MNIDKSVEILENEKLLSPIGQASYTILSEYKRLAKIETALKELIKQYNGIGTFEYCIGDKTILEEKDFYSVDEILEWYDNIEKEFWKWKNY